MGGRLTETESSTGQIHSKQGVGGFAPSAYGLGILFPILILKEINKPAPFRCSRLKEPRHDPFCPNIPIVAQVDLVNLAQVGIGAA